MLFSNPFLCTNSTVEAVPFCCLIPCSSVGGYAAFRGTHCFHVFEESRTYRLSNYVSGGFSYELQKIVIYLRTKHKDGCVCSSRGESGRKR